MPSNISTCIYFRYRRAFAFSSIPSLHYYQFSLRITFLDLFQEQYKVCKFSIERYTGLGMHYRPREMLVTKLHRLINFLLYYLLALVYQLLTLVVDDDLYYAFTLHLPYQLSSTHPVMVTRRVFFSRFIPRITILRYIVRSATLFRILDSPCDNSGSFKGRTTLLCDHLPHNQNLLALLHRQQYESVYMILLLLFILVI